MKKLAVLLVAVAALAAVSCGGRKHDAAYYEQMIDSIRKAEQLKQLQQQAGIYSDPVEAWFDTLHLRPLPLQTAGAHVERIASFTMVPMAINEHFGFDTSDDLRAVSLPARYGHPVLLLCHMQDSITPALYLYTMDRKHQPLDLLCLYEQKAEDREEDFGLSFNEYFITSQYEITVMHYYQSHDIQRRPVLEDVRRYHISRDGLFEEQPILLE